MIFHQPFWLLLLLPAGVLLALRPLASRTLTVFRALILLSVISSLAGPAVKLDRRDGVTVVLADRSYSMPPGSEGAQAEAVKRIQEKMGKSDALGVVSFGDRPSVERFPEAREAFTGFVHRVDGDLSDLSRALETGLSLIPDEVSGRVLILSDGRWTGEDPLETAALAATRGIPVDYRLFRRSRTDAVAVTKLTAPESAAPGESFVIRAEIETASPGEVAYTLRRNGAAIAAGKVQTVGSRRLFFRDTAGDPGTRVYSLELGIPEGEADAVPENNRARLLVGIRGPRPVLLLTDHAESGLGKLLAGSGMDIRSISPNKMEWSLDILSGFSAVILENLPAESIGNSGMDLLASWVDAAGSGLMITGGKNAYGTGGYFRSPLEPILPVSMELREEHRKLRMAIVAVLDRSGSMGMKVDSFRTKMDLANIGAVQVLDLMSPSDAFGLVAVDSAVHTIVDLTSARNADAARGVILSVAASGGGIFVYPGLLAASRMLVNAEPETRHIILFADAADAEEPGDYRNLLEKCASANITVSVIGLGTPADKDAALLEDIAHRGGGRIFFTDRPEELPRLFAQDTFAVARSAFVEGETAVAAAPGMAGLTETVATEFPSIGGYNLCYLRPEAGLAVVSGDEYKAPVAAYWQAGGGRVICYTGEADGNFSGEMSSWAGAGTFFSGMARWAVGPVTGPDGGMMVTRELRRGSLHLELHLDPESGEPPFTGTPSVSVIRSSRGEKPAVEAVSMKWLDADTLGIRIPLKGSETVLPSIHIPGRKPHSLSPVCLPYSPEFLPSGKEAGKQTLAEIAAVTGGIQRADLTGIWEELPRKPRYVDLSIRLIFSALICFLLEILERRTGWLAVKSVRRKRIRKAKAGKPMTAEQTGLPRKKKGAGKGKAAAAEFPTADRPEPVKAEEAVLPNPLTQAKRRAGHRMRRRSSASEDKET